MRRTLLLLLLLPACDDGGNTEPLAPDAAPTPDAAPAGPCVVGETTCFEGRLRTCLEDESGWLERACRNGTCMDGACVEFACAPGVRECADGGARTCSADGLSWGETTPCADAQTCLDGVCLDRLCEPGEVACGEGVSLTCDADGLRWGRKPCAADEVCVDGACGPPRGGCEEGRVLCAAAERFECVDGSWEIEACADGELCFADRCVGCVRDADCPGVCVDGACAELPLEITTERLPAGQISEPYAAALMATGGAEPYTWRLAEGELPLVLELDAETGEIAGTPRRADTFPLVFEVEDASGATARRELSLDILGAGLRVATNQLPSAEEGEDYEFALEAVGGTEPHGWFVVDGALPEGVALGGDGVLRGRPSEVGPFEFRVRVVDAETPPGFAEKDLVFEVEVAPLRIVGDQILDLFVAKIVTLPTITVVPNLPVPYETNLQARGGLRPLMWSEEDVIPELRGLFMQAGIPEGLVLEENGRLHGAVDSLDEVVEFQVPFTEIVLTGFFFFAEVRDSQGVPDADSAMFVLPTIPIGN